MISVEDALAAVLATVRLMPTQRLPVHRARGRALAHDVTSSVYLPPFTNAAMDGFAVRVADLHTLPVALPVSATLLAGATPQAPILPGTCVRIMTGAVVPDGADAIVPIEWTSDPDKDPVTVRRAPASGQYIRLRGKDISPGDVACPAGTRITPPVVGMLAALGQTEVLVRTPPRVAVIVTGDEVVPPAASPRLGQIRDANGPGLSAQVHDAGGRPRPVCYASDTLASLEAALQAAEAADVLVLAGGVSVGTHDLVEQALVERGFHRHFWRVKQRPGKPLLFGMLDGRPVFGLPGNPVSAAVCFEHYVRPWLAAACGHPQRPRFAARLAADLTKPAGLYHFVRGVTSVKNGVRWVTPTGAQDSNLYTSMLRADGLIHLPEPMCNPRAGTWVDVEAFAWQG